MTGSWRGKEGGRRGREEGGGVNKRERENNQMDIFVHVQDIYINVCTCMYMHRNRYY